MGSLRLTALLPLLALPPLIASLGGCGAQSAASAGQPASGREGKSARTLTSVARTRTSVHHASGIAVLGDPMRARARWRPAASVNGSVAVWAAQRPGVSLLRFDQSLLRLRLHAGIGEPAGTGWAGGSAIGPAEARTVVAGFNGGFRLNLPGVGFLLRGKVGVPLHAGLASVVTYAGGQTDIGRWRSEVPAPGAKVESALQNLHLLIDQGRISATIQGCVQECWGATLGGGVDVARSGLGITGEGQLVWAGGESLSPGALAQALLAAGARRAVQLDINPEWVASYLYVHRPGGPLALQVVPTQPGIPGQLLSPYNRDFFTVLTR